MSLDNPAARLHTILSAVKAQENANTNFITAWTQALGGSSATVTRDIVRVAALLADIERLVSRVDDQRISDLFKQHSPEWRRSVLMPNTAWANSTGELVDAGALTALGALATLFSFLGSEGDAPDDEALRGLRDALAASLDEVRTDPTLPQEVRRLLVARLHDMLWAIDHLDVMGPEGVKAAAERLAGAVAVSSDVRRSGAVVTKCLKLAGRIWTAFTFPGQVGEAIEGWDQVANLLPSA